MIRQCHNHTLHTTHGTVRKTMNDTKSKYDQELPQSHSADQPMAPCRTPRMTPKVIDYDMNNHNHTVQTNPRNCEEDFE